MLVLTHTFNPFGSQVSRGTDFVHPMIPLLLASTLSCSDVKEIIDSIRPFDYSEEGRAELVQILKDEAPKDCWDAND